MMKEKLLRHFEELKNIKQEKNKDQFIELKKENVLSYSHMSIVVFVCYFILMFYGYISNNFIFDHTYVKDITILYLIILYPISILYVFLNKNSIRDRESDNNGVEEDIFLNKDQIVYFYKPLHDFFGKKALAEEMSARYEDTDEQDEREMGDINLVIYLYEKAINNIEDLEMKEKRLIEIETVLNEDK